MNDVGLDYLIRDSFESIMELRKEGAKEYAHGDNPFRNFESVGEYLDLPREKVLLVYFLKHVDGITAWVNGHRSQREEVEGRIFDAIVYLFLLLGMVEDSKQGDTETFSTQDGNVQWEQHESSD